MMESEIQTHLVVGKQTHILNSNRHRRQRMIQWSVSFTAVFILFSTSNAQITTDPQGAATVEENLADILLFTGTYNWQDAGCTMKSADGASNIPGLKINVTYMAVQGTCDFNATLLTPVDYEKTRSFIVYVYLRKDCFGLESEQKITKFVTVGNVMDTPPAFTNSVYSASIPENHVVNTVVIANIRALDADGIDSVKYVVNFLDQQNKVFRTQQQSNREILDIYLISPVDFEQQHTYRFTITAVDTVGMNSTCDVIIKVINIQDVPPYFTALQYNGRVREDAELGTLVLSVSAIDGDSVLLQGQWEGTTANQIYYSIIDGGEGMFAINSSTAEITTITQLDIDSNTNVTNGLVVLKIMIIKWMLENIQSSCKANKIVVLEKLKILSVPLFSMPIVDFRKEDAKQLVKHLSFYYHGFNCIQLKATRKGEFECTEENEELNTSMEPQYGASSSTVLVLVQIEDANDNRPQFSSQSFTGSIRADAVAGELITLESGGYISVHDIDQAPGNNRFCLYIEKNGQLWHAFKPNIEMQFAYASVMIQLNKNDSLTDLAETHIRFQIVAQECGHLPQSFAPTKADITVWVKTQILPTTTPEPINNLPLSTSDIIVFIVGFLLLLNIGLTVFICYALRGGRDYPMTFLNRNSKYHVSGRKQTDRVYNDEPYNRTAKGEELGNVDTSKRLMREDQVATTNTLAIRTLEPTNRQNGRVNTVNIIGTCQSDVTMPEDNAEMLSVSEKRPGDKMPLITSSHQEKDDFRSSSTTYQSPVTSQLTQTGVPPIALALPYSTGTFRINKEPPHVGVINPVFEAHAISDDQQTATISPLPSEVGKFKPAAPDKNGYDTPSSSASAATDVNI